ncbi:MAG TPA: AbrB/MazE/SpoVT family DNA-binding domain-containing protein [Solirubrobacteraceae bacterium]|nr:AbrB/MazE/SpoVT family DNA-binding domain-containing protein [Solirubrobacteraceae bacterium]
MLSTVSEKGQITVPKRLRDRLGIRAGDQLELNEEDGRLVARKALASDPVTAVYGILDIGESTDERLRALRGEPDAA